MTDRLTEIKARLDKAINVSELCAHPAFDGKKVWFNEHYSREFSSTQHAELIAHCPDDIRWLMTELEQERAEHDSTLQINRELEEEKDELKQTIAGYIEIARKLALVRRAGNDLIQSVDGLVHWYHESGEMCWCNREACFHQGRTSADCRVANDAIRQWKQVNKT